ncbi:MAG: rhodanese-like domain-containing protein [Verrucomicrobiaceae bacterium]|nr:rhodanese-like domain-containing protein [Verrucomicrobiaceae bacterium]
MNRILQSLITFALLAACKPVPIPEPPSGPPEVKLPAHYEWVKVDAAEQLIASTPDLQIMDVRSDPEIKNGDGWLKGARWASYLHDNRRFLEVWEKDKPWLVYCALGPRSELTAADMAALGYKKVYLLEGGFNAWMAAHKPVQK